MTCAEGKAGTPSRRKTKVGNDLSARLRAYAAAGAATTGLLAGAQFASADIIYTPANTFIQPPDIVPLDLDHNDTADFRLTDQFATGTSFSSVGTLRVAAPQGNGVILAHRPGTRRFDPAALAAGAAISSGRRFRQFHYGGYLVHFFGLSQGSFGYWRGATDRYLGLEFQIDGETHYGWAELSVNGGPYHPGHPIEAVLMGYAYNTVAGQEILAGQESASGQITPATALGTLGMLALGSVGRSITRMVIAHNAIIDWARPFAGNDPVEAASLASAVVNTDGQPVLVMGQVVQVRESAGTAWIYLLAQVNQANKALFTLAGTPEQVAGVMQTHGANRWAVVAQVDSAGTPQQQTTPLPEGDVSAGVQAAAQGRCLDLLYLGQGRK